MTPELARFIVNTRDTFSRLSDQQLYQLAVSLAAELHERHTDAEPEARALCAALLAHAHIEQRAIFSEDCTGRSPDELAWSLATGTGPLAVKPPAE